MSLGGFKNDSLAILNSLDDDLGEWNVSKLELALVLLLLEAHIENIDWTTERTNTNLWTIRFPGNWSDWVVVLNLFAADFIPLRSFGVEIVHVESVEVTNYSSFTSCVEISTSEFLHLLVLRVVEFLEAITWWLIESDLAIVSSSQDMWTPSKSVRNSWVSDLCLLFGIKIEGKNSTIQMTWAYPLAIGWWADTHTEGIWTIDWGTLVGLEDTLLNLTLGGTNN